MEQAGAGKTVETLGQKSSGLSTQYKIPETTNACCSAANARGLLKNWGKREFSEHNKNNNARPKLRIDTHWKNIAFNEMAGNDAIYYQDRILIL